MLPIGYIKPYKNNPRKNDEAISYVMDSLREFGWQQPLVIDTDSVLIVGHTRLLAAKKLGYAEVPCVIADKLTPAQAKAYRIMDNRSGEIATWDKELLFPELDDILSMDMSYDMEFFKFASYEVPSAADLVDDAPAPEPPKKKEKEKPKPAPEPNFTSQYGVIIMCENEDEQKNIFDSLTEEGYTCKVVVT